jgi:hypothetical protein
VWKPLYPRGGPDSAIRRSWWGATPPGCPKTLLAPDNCRYQASAPPPKSPDRLFDRTKEHLVAFVEIAFVSILSRRLKRLVIEEVSA